MTPSPETPGFSDASAPRTSGVFLLATSLTAVIFMAMHPTVHHHDIAGFVAEVSDGATRNRLVHAVLIAVQVVMLVGLLGVAQQLGFGRALTRLGVVAAAAAVAAGSAAATINGLVVPKIAMEYHDITGPKLDALTPSFVVCHSVGETCSQIYVVALSVAILAWSLEIIVRKPRWRPLGIGGVIAGGAPLAALMAGVLPMSLHGFGAAVLVESIWFVAAAMHLLGRRTVSAA